MEQSLQYVVIQCPDCMFYECKWDNQYNDDNAPVCIDCGSLDVIVARCRPHNWDRYAKS
jgi:hypothetical protein